MIVYNLQELAETAPVESDDRLYFRDRCMDVLDSNFPTYVCLTYWVSPSVTMLHFYPRCEQYLLVFEMMRELHLRRNGVCKTPEIHAHFSADPSRSYTRSEIAVARAHGNVHVESLALIEPQRLRQIFEKHPDRCVCRCWTADQPYRKRLLSYFYRRISPSGFLPPVYPWIEGEPRFEPLDESRALALRDYRSACDRELDRVTKAMLSLSWEQGRETFARILEDVVELLPTREHWTVLVLRPNRSDGRFPVLGLAVPSAVGLDKWLWSDQIPSATCPCGGRQTILRHHDFDTQSGMLFSLFERMGLPNPERSRLVWLGNPRTLFSACVRKLGPEFLDSADLLRSFEPEDRSPNTVLVLPKHARVLSKEQIEARLGGRCPRRFLEDVENAASLFEPPWDWFLKEELRFWRLAHESSTRDSQPINEQ